MKKKHFTKSTPFQIKTQQSRIEGNYLNIIKAMHKNPIPKFILNGENLNAFSLITRTRVPAFTTFIQLSTRCPRQKNKAPTPTKKRNKGSPKWRERSKIISEQMA